MSVQDEIIGIQQAKSNSGLTEYAKAFEAGRQHGKNEATDKFDLEREEKAMEFGEIVQNTRSLKVTIQELINNFSMESVSDTPDFILADFLVDCLTSYDRAIVAREKWHGRDCGGRKGPIPVGEPTSPPEEPQTSKTPKPLEALDDQEGSGAETFDNHQSDRLDSFTRGYKAGYNDASEYYGSIAEDEACANIFKSARENGMSLAVAYSMAYAAAQHIDGKM